MTSLPNATATYATALGLSHVCNSSKTVCEGEVLPGHTSRATEAEKAVGVDATYAIYSGRRTPSCTR